MPALASFDGAARIAALDAQRAEPGLDWAQLADELWDQSHDLNLGLADDCLCSGALVRTARRGTMTCQYALVLLRWIGRTPEEFLVGPAVDVGTTALPVAGPGHRLRFDLPLLHGALDQRRRERGLTWTALAEELRCTPSRLTDLRRARLADAELVLRVTQWLGRPAAAFVVLARW
ncbi:hypothetical protein [Quadrisphaera setariae]|uniref:HTH cro/C1-type domain-containing protein n=1 Tax=Quadrisphaera setariae TaxID=2593304 RepID=A0A5C8Z5F8_9ACTN|nr:hypothetical protein [Quadrisphaera setariae]TXR52519.1 hypothetical protein FMM08_18860 [Quadrisphaera setariae]